MQRLEATPQQRAEPSNNNRWQFKVDIRAALACLVFFAVKLALLDYRFGDGNAYLYDAFLLTRGAIPYRDFLHADFPVQIGILALLRPFFANWVMGYHLVPVALEAMTAYLLFLILAKSGNRFAWLAPAVHLFTFTVLSTSDFITGVQMACFFYVLGWYLYDGKKPYLCGISFALSFLTKMYTLPAAAIFGVVELYQRRFQSAGKILIGTVLTVAAVITPFLLIAFQPMIEQTVLLHFNRPAGINKSDIILFFSLHEWALITASLPGLWLCRKQPLAPAFVITCLFFIFFRDLYFVYLDFTIPFMIVFTLTTIDHLWEGRFIQKMVAAILLMAISINCIFSGHSYFTHFQKLGHFSNAMEIATSVNKLNPSLELYGSHEVTPLVSLLSGRLIFHNHADTNTQAFAAGVLDREQISTAAVNTGVYLLARVTHAPEMGYYDIGYQGYFSPERFADSCQRTLTFPSTSLESDNQIAVYKCEKNHKP